MTWFRWWSARLLSNWTGARCFGGAGVEALGVGIAGLLCGLESWARMDNPLSRRVKMIQQRALGVNARCGQGVCPWQGRGWRTVPLASAKSWEIAFLMRLRDAGCAFLSIAQRGWKRGIAGAGRLDNMYWRRLDDLVVLIFDGQG